MLNFAANLTMLFTEHSLLDRFGAAARTGFAGVELLFPYDEPAATLATRCQDESLEFALINAPPGDWEGGMRGLAALPGEESAFDRSLDEACAYLESLAVKTLHVMAGIVPEDADPAPYWETYRANLARAADRVASLGVTVTIEPLNSRDVPGYLLSRQADAASVIRDVGAANLGLQFDLYHCQIMEGDLTTRLETLAPLIRHVQVAGVPNRHEPDIGEINYPFLFRQLEEIGYQGWIGCEYHPRGRTEDGLSWRPD